MNLQQTHQHFPKFCACLYVISEDVKQGEKLYNLTVPEPKVEVQHIVHSLQVNKVLDIFGRDQWPADVSTHPGKSQWLISAELPSKLQTNTHHQGIFTACLTLIHKA